MERIRRLKQMARVERRFREFDAMKFVLHGLHLKEHYRFIQRRKRPLKTYENSLKSFDDLTSNGVSDLSDNVEVKDRYRLHNINFTGEGEKGFVPGQKLFEQVVVKRKRPGSAEKSSDGPKLNESLPNFSRTSDNFYDEGGRVPYNLQRDDVTGDNVGRQITSAEALDRNRVPLIEGYGGKNKLPKNFDLNDFKRNQNRSFSPQAEPERRNLLDTSVVSDDSAPKFGDRSQFQSSAPSRPQTGAQPGDRSVFQSSAPSRSQTGPKSVFQSSAGDDDAENPDDKGRSVFQSSRNNTEGQRSIFQPSQKSEFDANDVSGEPSAEQL